MSDNTLNHFLFEYIRTLKERSRFEKSGFKNGLDWLIYELGIQKKWMPIRTPFSIEAGQNIRSKSEGELGIDVSFLSEDKEELYIFVLKDERLNNKNWTDANFDSDIRKAASPNMNQEGLDTIKTIRIFTVYNKDEDRNGVQLYESLTDGYARRFGDRSQYERIFQRWNLTKLAEEVGNHLITPELLPNQLTSQFRYICSQIKDFDYCSKEWVGQLEPNWKNFVEAVLCDDINENKINLLALSIYILKDSWKSEEKSYAGWIDLVEWAMLALWRRYYKLGDTSKDIAFKAQIFSIWAKVYLVELEIYFLLVGPVLRIQHGLSIGNLSFDMNFVPINDAFRAYWHMGRLGLLNIATQDIDFGSNSKEIFRDRVTKTSELLNNFLMANPATSRPLVDLHHIELYLVWLVLYQAGKKGDIFLWLSQLENVLTVRRFSKAVNLPFIQSSNNLDSLVENIIRGEEHIDDSDESSSYLILMLIELCFSLSNNQQRDDLIERYLRRLVKGVGDEDKPYLKKDENERRIDLLSWSPPENWEEKLISGSLAHEGVGVTTGNFERQNDSKETPLSERIKLFVDSMRSKFPPVPPKKLPLSVCILACLKHRSPLPPEFWRGTIFPVKVNEEPEKAGDGAG